MDQDKHSHLPFLSPFLPRLLEHLIQRLKARLRRDVHMTSATFEVHMLDGSLPCALLRRVVIRL